MAKYSLFFLMFAALCLVSSNAAPADNVESLLKIPAECKGKPFCHIKPEGYDELEHKINSALPDFLQKDYGDRYGPSEGSTLSPEEDWHNCPYVTTTQSMYLHNDGGNDTKIDIFVQTKLFRQYVDIVTCATEKIDTNSEEQCFSGLGISTFGMKSECKSTTAKRTLYVYDLENSKVVQKSFDVPACCTCKVSYK